MVPIDTEDEKSIIVHLYKLTLCKDHIEWEMKDQRYLNSKIDISWLNSKCTLYGAS